MNIGKCVYCLKKLNNNTQTKDHIFPRLGHTSDIPASIQIWTVPSCEKCNKKFGYIEEDLFLRLSMCIPELKATAMGIPTMGLKRIFFLLGKDSQSIGRKKSAFTRVADDIKSLNDRSGQDLLIPPNDGVRRPFAIRFPREQLDQFAYKLACSLEYKLRNNYLGHKRKITYWLYGENEFNVKNENTIIWDNTLTARGVYANQGIGFEVSYIINKKFNQVLYRVILWGTYQFYIFISNRKHGEKVVQYIPVTRKPKFDGMTI